MNFNLRYLKAVIVFLISAITLQPALAQKKANLTVNIHLADYTSWSEGNISSGCNFTTKYVSVNIDNRTVGYLHINNETETYSLKIDTVVIPNDGKLKLVFKYGYRHFC